MDTVRNRIDGAALQKMRTYDPQPIVQELLTGDGAGVFDVVE